MTIFEQTCSCGKHKGIGSWCPYRRAATYARCRATGIGYSPHMADFLKRWEKVHGRAIPVDLSHLNGKKSSITGQTFSNGSQFDQGGSPYATINRMKNTDQYAQTNEEIANAF